MARKFAVGQRVRVREDSLYAVASYQSKPLGFRRIVGVITRVTGDGDRVMVDFCQRDIPRRPDGKLYGEKTRVSGLYRRRHGYRGHGYPISILEKA